MGAPHHWQLTVDCHDPSGQVAFWSAALGYVVAPPPEGFGTWNDWYRSVGVPEDELDLAGDGSDRIEDPAGHGPRIWFQPVPEAKSVKNRLHLDLDVADRRATSYAVRRPLVEARVAELVVLGATAQRVTDEPEHDRYSVLMHDPEGNEFCVS